MGEKVTCVWVLLCVAGWCSPPAASQLQLSTSVAIPGVKVKEGTSAAPVAGNGTLAVPHLECGYVLCQAPEVFTNASTHLWDYYVDWERPPRTEDDPGIFVLANRYQMPRAYLVFKGFTANFSGDYQCVLHFRRAPLVSVGLTLTFDETLTARDCNNT
nr:uncharacterized protein LOC123746619 [Procambarus clarkii]